MTIQKRLAHGFSARASRSGRSRCRVIDIDTTGNTGKRRRHEPEDNNNHFLDRQRSDFDQRHVVARSIVWKPNYGFNHRVERLIVNGWTFTSIIRLQSGVPFNITTGSDNNADGVTNDRPNLMPGVAHPTVTDNGHSRVAMITTGSALHSSASANTALNGTNTCPQQGRWSGRFRRNGSSEFLGRSRPS